MYSKGPLKNKSPSFHLEILKLPKFYKKINILKNFYTIR